MNAAARIPLRDRAAGRWHIILPALGIDGRYLVNKQMACPICDGGTDRFIFDNKEGRGTFICRKCGAGDGVSLVMLKNGLGFKEAALRIEEVLGAGPIEPVKNGKPALLDATRRKLLNDLWARSVPVTEGDPVSRYLARRCRVTNVPTEVHYLADCKHRDEDGVETVWPAMVARLRSGDGRPSQIHRTYLTPEGDKAPVKPAKRLMPGERVEGDAIRLGAHEGVLGIAEGIETALSARTLYGIPCWAAVTAGGLQVFDPPEGVDSIIVYGDHDESYTGQAAAFALAKRLTAKGMTVQVLLPDNIGEDWNDVLTKSNHNTSEVMPS